ncbi:hypothetical protein SAY86_016842 [Trapa natans]|uniref:Uncharacterized protein n=1 Tax=Trapa natans TaxID=22666 RepID=A0AAN7LJP7_TRANT|nr:hypothetical protein SAY86_016842 [Trapa natans]
MCVRRDRARGEKASLCRLLTVTESLAMARWYLWAVCPVSRDYAAPPFPLPLVVRLKSALTLPGTEITSPPTLRSFSIRFDSGTNPQPSGFVGLITARHSVFFSCCCQLSSPSALRVLIHSSHL